VRTLQNPRIDMPFANEVGEGIIAGRSRQIIPQPLPEVKPEFDIAVDDYGVVRLRWERSPRTIGLITEIHRWGDLRSGVGVATPSESSLIGRTELAEFTDKNAPTGAVLYALVFVSDPAETSGTVRSGAVLSFACFQAPTQARLEFRCPLATIEPQKSDPIYRVVEVPSPTAPPAVLNLRAVSRPGMVRLQWDEGRIGQFRYNVYAGGQRLTPEPIFGNSFDIRTGALESVEYIVETVGRIAGGRTSVMGQPLPPREGTVFSLTPGSGHLVAPATFDGDELDLSRGGYFVVPHDDNFNVHDGGFTVEFSVKFDSIEGSPVVVCNGFWNRAGWFFQAFNGQWRFHVDGVNCDGGAVRVGEWLHIVGTFDGQTLRLYENGTLIAHHAASANRTPWLDNLVIGQYSQTAPGFQVRGRIRDVRIWHRVLE